MSAKTNAIGLGATSAAEISADLNELLSNYSVFYQNVRGFHWNIKGENFFELHMKFEELYTDLHLKIDEIAERILTLGSTPHHSFGAFLETSAVKPAENIKDGKRAVQRILSALSTILLLQRELLKMSDSAGDEGTNSLMSEYIKEQEKLVWMYTAYLGA